LASQFPRIWMIKKIDRKISRGLRSYDAIDHGVWTIMQRVEDESQCARRKKKCLLISFLIIPWFAALSLLLQLNNCEKLADKLVKTKHRKISDRFIGDKAYHATSAHDIVLWFHWTPQIRPDCCFFAMMGYRSSLFFPIYAVQFSHRRKNYRAKCISQERNCEIMRITVR